MSLFIFTLGKVDLFSDTSHPVSVFVIFKSGSLITIGSDENLRPGFGSKDFMIFKLLARSVSLHAQRRFQ